MVQSAGNDVNVINNKRQHSEITSIKYTSNKIKVTVEVLVRNVYLPYLHKASNTWYLFAESLEF